MKNTHGSHINYITRPEIYKTTNTSRISPADKLEDITYVVNWAAEIIDTVAQAVSTISVAKNAKEANADANTEE